MGLLWRWARTLVRVMWIGVYLVVGVALFKSEETQSLATRSASSCRFCQFQSKPPSFLLLESVVSNAASGFKKRRERKLFRILLSDLETSPRLFSSQQSASLSSANASSSETSRTGRARKETGDIPKKVRPEALSLPREAHLTTQPPDSLSARRRVNGGGSESFRSEFPAFKNAFHPRGREGTSQLSPFLAPEVAAHSTAAAPRPPLSRRDLSVSMRRKGGALELSPERKREALSLALWLKQSATPLHGVVVNKTREGLVVSLSPPAAAEGLVPSVVRLMYDSFLHSLTRSEGEAGDAKDEAARRAEFWKKLFIGKNVVLRVAEVETNLFDSSGLPRLHLQVVIPERPAPQLSPEDREACDVLSDTLKETSAFSDESLPKDEASWEEFLRTQPVSRVLRALSPPSVDWMLPPNLPEKASQAGLGSYRFSSGALDLRSSTAKNKLHAPPSRLPQTCRIVGVLSSLASVVVEIKGEDFTWLDELLYKVHSQRRWSWNQFQAAQTQTSRDRRQELAKQTSPFSFFGGSDEAFALADRTLAVEQDTQRNVHRQEELLAFRFLLRDRIGPGNGETLLRNFERILQSNPTVHAYQQQLHVYPKAQRESASGIFALLPLREIREYSQEHPEWKVTEPLRLYFSWIDSSAIFNTPHLCQLRRRRLPPEERRDAAETLEEGGLLWLSIHPGVPMEVAHLLLHDAPVPFIAPYLRLYEQKELVLQQYRHRSFIEAFNLYHQMLAQRRAAVREAKRAASGEASTQDSTETSSSTQRASSRTNGGWPDGRRVAKVKQSKLPPPTPEQVPMAPMWWMIGDLSTRWLKLRRNIGPFLFRRFFWFKRRVESAPGRHFSSGVALDPLGEAYQNITHVRLAVRAALLAEWIDDPDKAPLLTADFTGVYADSLRVQLLYTQPQDLAKVFPRLMDGMERCNAEEDFSRINSSDLPAVTKRNLSFFVRLRHWMFKQSLALETPALVAPSEATFKPSKRPVHLSPLMRLMKLHCTYERIDPPLPAAPSRIEQERREKFRDLNKKDRESSDTSGTDPTERRSRRVRKKRPSCTSCLVLACRTRLQTPRWDFCTAFLQSGRIEWTSERHEIFRQFLLCNERALERATQTPPPVTPPDPQIDGFGSNLSSEANFKQRSFYNYVFEGLLPTADDSELRAFQFNSGGDGPFPERRAIVPLVIPKVVAGGEEEEGEL